MPIYRNLVETNDSMSVSSAEPYIHLQDTNTAPFECSF